MLVCGAVSGFLVACFGALWTLFLLLAMNGFSERRADQVLGAYTVLVLGAVAGGALIAGLLARRLGERAADGSTRLGVGRGAVAVVAGSAAASLGLAVASTVVMAALAT